MALSKIAFSVSLQVTLLIKLVEIVVLYRLRITIMSVKELTSRKDVNICMYVLVTFLYYKIFLVEAR